MVGLTALSFTGTLAKVSEKFLVLLWDIMILLHDYITVLLYYYRILYYYVILVDSFVDFSRPPAQAKASCELGVGLRVWRREIFKTSKG